VPAPDATATAPDINAAAPAADAGIPPADAGETLPDEESLPEPDPSADDTTEEIDITDLVNMVKSVKKQLENKPQEENASLQKIDDVFSKLGELEGKLGEMDNVLAKIDQLGAEIQQVKPKTPIEKLEMRSLDSYPFNKKPDEFFSEKQQEMQLSGKNEYQLTKSDVENYGKYEIMKSFNPEAQKNPNF